MNHANRVVRYEVLSGPVHRAPDARPLRIGIDGFPLLGANWGPRRFFTELCRELDHLLPQARFFVYSPRPVEVPVQSERWTARVDPSVNPLGRKRTLWTKFREGGLCYEDDLDVFWAEGPFVPRLNGKVRLVLAVHDLLHQVDPETLSYASLCFYRVFLRRAAKRATFIHVLSRGTAQRLLQAYGCDAKVVRPSVCAEFRPRGKAEIAECVARYEIRRPYLLTVTSWNRNKNIPLLIDTFIGMKRDAMLRDCTFVIAGEGANRGPTMSRASRMGTIDTIVALGRIPDADLPALYSGASAFVFPSRYEGFGIPVLEARACGTPVVATDIPELREAGGHDAIYVAPTEAGLRRGIQDALEFTGRPRIRPRLWTWEDSARILARALTG